MRNEEDTGHIVRDKQVTTSISLTYKTSTVPYFTIYQGKKEKHIIINFC